MKCPHCRREVESKVIETRQYDGVVYRRRRCDECEKVFITTELPQPLGMSMPRHRNRTRPRGSRRSDPPTQTKQISLDLFEAWGRKEIHDPSD